MARCPCGATVLWVPNAKTGHRAPVDPKPNPEGNVVMDAHGYRVLTKAELAAPNVDGETRYVLHFASCPQASVYRHRDQTAHRKRVTG